MQRNRFYNGIVSEIKLYQNNYLYTLLTPEESISDRCNNSEQTATQQKTI